MTTIRLRHPDLPDQPIEVDEIALVHYGAAGWVLDDSPKPPAPPVRVSRTDNAPADAEGATSDSEPAPATAPRRRATKEADEK